MELALKDRFPSSFTYREPAAPETISTGMVEVDRVTGGLPRGGLSEICGPPSSGRTASLLSMLAEAAATGDLGQPIEYLTVCRNSGFRSIAVDGRVIL